MTAFPGQSRCHTVCVLEKRNYPSTSDTVAYPQTPPEGEEVKYPLPQVHLGESFFLIQCHAMHMTE